MNDTLKGALCVFVGCLCYQVSATEPMLHERAARELKTELSEAEEHLLDKIEQGEVACYLSQTPEENDPHHGDDWTSERRLRASMIEWLFDQRAEGIVTQHGIRIEGAAIVGKIDLNDVDVPFQFSFRRCLINDGLSMVNARVRGLRFDSSVIRGGIAAEGLVSSATVSCRAMHCEGGLELAGARIQGDLDCTRARLDDPNKVACDLKVADISGDVLLANAFKGVGLVRMLGATVGGDVDCEGGSFKSSATAALTPWDEGVALDLENARVSGSVYLRRGFVSEGQVKMLSAQVSGQLSCAGGTFCNSQKVGEGALYLDRMTVGGDVLLRNDSDSGLGFKADGEVRMLGASIGGQLSCSGGVFINPGDDALSCHRVRVKGVVLLRRGFEANGAVRFPGADVGGRFECRKARFFNAPEDGSFDEDEPGVLNLVNANLQDRFIWREIEAPEGMILDLRSTSIDTLNDDAQSLPGELRLAGLTYDAMLDQAEHSVEYRKKWLALGTVDRSEEEPKDKVEVFHAQPYEQLADVYRRAGSIADAKNILVAKENARATYMPLFERLWHNVNWMVIGYGYRPWLALLWISMFIFLGWLISRQAAPRLFRSTTSDPAKFNAFMYSVDSFVPIIEFRQAKNWAPDARAPGSVRLAGFRLTGSRVRIYFWIHTAVGWILTVFLAAAVSGLIQR